MSSSFLGIGIALFLLLSELKHSVSPVYNKWQYRVDTILSRADTLEYLSVGNSLSYAIDFQEISPRGYSIWQPGNDIFECEYQLKSLLPELPALRTVSIGLAFISFYRDNALFPQDRLFLPKEKYRQILREMPTLSETLKITDHDFFVEIDLSNVQQNKISDLGGILAELQGMVEDRLYNRRKFYGASPAFKWIPNDFSNFFQGKILEPLATPDHFRTFLETMISPNGQPLEKALQLDRFGRNNTPFRFQQPPRDSLNKKTIEITVPKFRITQDVTLNIDPAVTERSFAAMERIVEFLQGKGVEVIIYIPPLYATYNAHFPETIRAPIRNFLDGLRQQYQLTYYDFSQDSLISNNHLYFNDGIHLNYYGAQAFSKKYAHIFNRNLATYKHPESGRR